MVLLDHSQLRLRLSFLHAAHYQQLHRLLLDPRLSLQLLYPAMQRGRLRHCLTHSCRQDLQCSILDGGAQYSVDKYHADLYQHHVELDRRSGDQQQLLHLCLHSVVVSDIFLHMDDPHKHYKLVLHLDFRVLCEHRLQLPTDRLQLLGSRS